MLVAVVALGLTSRLRPIGLPLYDKWLGDALYAVAAYLVLALVFPRWPRRRLAVVALLLCIAVEFFKLTGIPARYVHVAPVRWLLGAQFAWGDIGCYFIGVVGAAGADSGQRTPPPALPPQGGG
jgi:hypothetical protein